MTAIAYTNRKNFFDNVDRTAYTLASWTPVSNAPFLVLVVNRQATGTPATPTLTGNGLTWTQIDTQLVGAGLIRQTTFYAAGIASPTTGTLVADFGGVTQDDCEVIVDQLTNANQTTPVNTANKQKAQGSAITSIATPSLAAIDGASSVWAAAAAQTNEAQTADATMTLIAEVHTTSSPCAAMTQYGTTLAPSESSATSQSRGIMAIEVVNAVPAGSGATATPSTLALTLATFAPTVTASDFKLVTPDTVALVLTTFAPTVTASAHQVVTPATLALVLTGFAPTVTAASSSFALYDDPRFIYDDPHLTYDGDVIGPQLVTPDTVALVLTTYAPVVAPRPAPPAPPPPQPLFADVLRTHHTPIARLLFLDDDLTTVLLEVVGSTSVLIDGSVVMDRLRDIHRSADVRIVNADGSTFSIQDGSSFVWPNRIVRIERGAMRGSTPEYVPLITGLIDVPQDAIFSGAVSFTVNSRLQLASVPFPAPITFAAGTRLRDVERAIAELAGLGTDDALYDLSAGGQVLAAARTFDQQDIMLTSMIKLAFDAGCDLWDTGAGVLTLRPFVDPAMVEPIWTFDSGADATLLGRTRALRAQPGVFNRATVIGSGPDRYPIRAEWKVTNPADPLYWTPDFDRPRQPYVSPDISTQQMANAVAARLGIEGALGQDEVSGNAIPNPLILRDGRPVVAYGAENHLLDRVEIPITKGSMSMTSKRVRSLLA